MTRTATEATSQPCRRKRSLRCLRCDARKFRTPRDLALHILSKHGHVSVPASAYEDANSITLNSPFIASSDIDELDQLLQAAERNRDSNRPVISSRGRHDRKSAVTIRQPSPQRVNQSPGLGSPSLRHGVAKRRWPWTTSSCASSSSAESKQRREQRPISGLEESIDENQAPQSFEENSPTEGESISPCTKDVYIANCRSGRIPLVPIPSQSPAMLNFADGLF